MQSCTEDFFGGKNKAQECSNWASHREMKKESHSCGRAAGCGDSWGESSEGGKTHSDSLGKQFPFGKIRQEILTCQIQELFTSTQHTAYCTYRVSNTKPGNHLVSSNLRESIMN